MRYSLAQNLSRSRHGTASTARLSHAAAAAQKSSRAGLDLAVAADAGELAGKHRLGAAAAYYER
jgi:hypothetical protein